MTDRYSASGAESEFEPGSRSRVLRNLLGINLVRTMQRKESELLLAATQRAIDETSLDQQFRADDLRRLHRDWLGEVYPWAGKYRSVNLSKDGFPFAAATEIPRLMTEFERGPLARFTPCRFDGARSQAEAIGIVHAELVLIHPFREGNGRCSRLLSVLMGLQAGLPALDFSGVKSAEKARYIGAIHGALAGDYRPMTDVFERIIARTRSPRST